MWYFNRVFNSHGRKNERRYMKYSIRNSKGRFVKLYKKEKTLDERLEYIQNELDLLFELLLTVLQGRKK